MDEVDEYQRLRKEIANHQEHSFRVMIYTMMVVGGVIGLKYDEPDMPLVVGVSVVLFSSLAYLIVVASKIFAIGAYIRVFHEEGTRKSWDTLLPEFRHKFKLLYETKAFAFIYLVVSGGFLYLFRLVNAPFVLTSFGILVLLCIMLFFTPNKWKAYEKEWRELKKR
jgi:hypothetical protein